MTNSYPMKEAAKNELEYLPEVGVFTTPTLEQEITGGISSKREQILQGAIQVFLHQGYAKTSMDRVAATAGVSKQTIYSHFQDKQRLFMALMERVILCSFQREFPPLFQGDPHPVLRKFAETFLAKMDDPQYIAFIRLVIAESTRFPELAQLYTRTVIQYGVQNLSSYFKSHPELNITDAEATARIFLGALAAFILSQEILQGKHTIPMEKERVINSLLHLILPK